ncbi:hypothetical protein IWQ60_008217 [Tieghemiomyces parasiticus]|uniref:Major facilitator superfamily (MFS) profile domain-containing protein n=1 Tax=Tieghemiomyces parasiticus TaxID=78921 RepID=A0A9W8DRX2_9FUNG|nr:hypothetical protein IWQ60_008217 [Tieghemiomyces parasiticus]
MTPGMPVTALPRRQIIALCLLRIAEPISFSVLFPFVYFMVQDFHVTDDPRDVAFYVGLLASTFSFAQLTTGMPWGMVSDRIGRRPVILTGAMATIACSVLFGLSPSLRWAILVRLVWGACNGSVSTAKTIMAELTDETNMARGFSLLPLCRNLGTLLGPVIGGLLSRPADHYPGLFGHSILFRRFPYLLPCLVCAAIGLCAWTLAFFLLEETLPYPRLRTNAAADECRPLLTPTPPPPSLVRPGVLASLVTAFGSDVRRVLAGVFLSALISVMLDDIYPVWSATTPGLGGLGLDSRAIGLTMAFSAGVVLYVQLVVYPRAQRQWGNVCCFRVGALLFGVASLALPQVATLERMVHPLPGGGPVPSLAPLTWLAMVATLVIRVCAGTFGFTSVNMLVSNAVTDRGCLGVVNGVAQSASSLARSLGPLIAGSLYSWSLAHSFPFPWDRHLVFVVMAFVSLAAYAISFTWPLRINHRQFSTLPDPAKALVNAQGRSLVIV